MASVTGARLSAILLLLSCPARAAADTLKITSTPPGATVEIDGVRAGTTPFETDYPGGYFHKTKTSMGSRLEHPMVARVSLAGYVTKEVRRTDGPMNWIEVIGINTQKLIKKNVTGISFALSATDLLEVLHRFYPNVSSASSSRMAGSAVSLASAVSPAGGNDSDEATSASSGAEKKLDSTASSTQAQTPDVPQESDASQTRRGLGTVAVTSDPDGAEIYVDEKFVGNTPAKLKLTEGSHVMILKAAGYSEWKRTLEVLKGSQVTLKPALERAP
jgi:hypothetical protein